jgi:hypothetical protein
VTLATHLASLNLFRNPDGTVNVTVAEGRGAIAELDAKGKLGATVPHDYVMKLVREAVQPKVDPTRNQPIASLGRVIVDPPMPLSLFREACERIADMLRQDDGEAFFEAEKFLRRHAPELYNAIGMEGAADGSSETEV